jgi:hypothetical protein
VRTEGYSQACEVSQWPKVQRDPGFRWSEVQILSPRPRLNEKSPLERVRIPTRGLFLVCFRGCWATAILLHQRTTSVGVEKRLIPAQNLVHFVGGFAEQRRHNVAIGVHRHADSGVPENLHDVAGLGSLGEQEAGATMA